MNGIGEGHRGVATPVVSDGKGYGIISGFNKQIFRIGYVRWKYGIAELPLPVGDISKKACGVIKKLYVQRRTSADWIARKSGRHTIHKNIFIKNSGVSTTKFIGDDQLDV